MQRLNVTGLKSPMPVLKVRRALMKLEAGELLEVTGDDPDLVMDLPAFCAQAGHRLVMARQTGGEYIFELARGEVGANDMDAKDATCLEESVVPLRRVG